MNDRVRELAEQAGLLAETWNNPEPFVVYKENPNNPGALEKFTQSIVQECVDVCRTGVIEGDFELANSAADRILRHFGIEG